MQCEYLAITYINRYKHAAITCKSFCLLCMDSQVQRSLMKSSTDVDILIYKVNVFMYTYVQVQTCMCRCQFKQSTGTKSQ